jgi:hypothetical protein
VSGLDASCWQTTPPRPGRTADSGSSLRPRRRCQGRPSSGRAPPVRFRGVGLVFGPFAGPALSRTGAPILLRDVWGPSVGPRRCYQSCLLLPRSCRREARTASESGHFSTWRTSLGETMCGWSSGAPVRTPGEAALVRLHCADVPGLGELPCGPSRFRPHCRNHTRGVCRTHEDQCRTG